MIAGAVLTGGSSTRMGTDKALLEVDGVPMASRVVAALRSVDCDPVGFVGGDPEALRSLGEVHVPDVAPGEGPAGGVVSALRAFGGEGGWVLIASCDLPYLASSDLRALLDSVESSRSVDVDVAVARTDRVQPLCALWRSSALGTVEAAFDSGVRSVFGLLDQLRVIEVPVTAEGLRNVNTMNDLGADGRQH